MKAHAHRFGGSAGQPFDPCYHKACDTVLNINRPVLEQISDALTYALAGIWGRRFARLAISPIQTAAGQVTVSTLLLLPLALLVDRPWTLPLPGAWTMAAVVALATLSTALGYILYFRILATAGATNLLLVTFLIPVSAIVLGASVLGEAIGGRQLAGMALIGAGLAAIDGRLARVLARRWGRQSGTPPDRPEALT